MHMRVFSSNFVAFGMELRCKALERQYRQAAARIRMKYFLTVCEDQVLDERFRRQIQAELKQLRLQHARQTADAACCLY
jgi:hypothetical protein